MSEGGEARNHEATECDLPPVGWRCTRESGHDGPCAAVPDDPRSVKDYKAMVVEAEAERAALRAFLGDAHMHPANERALLVKLHRAIAAYLDAVRTVAS